MRSTLELVREHAAIEELLARFERVLDGARRDGQADAEALGQLLDFFEQEVDDHHQRKEERLLLHCGERAPRGDLQRVLHEHDEERRLLAVFRDNLCGARFGEPNCIAALSRYGASYLDLQRAHSSWEERTLFPLAERVLGPGDDRVLLDGLCRMDGLHGGSLCAAARALEEWLDRRSPPVLA